MAEQQAPTQFSISTTSQNKQQPDRAFFILKQYLASIILALLGFYFLIFAIVELVTNYESHAYRAPMECTANRCVGRFSAVSFPAERIVYLYLLNPTFMQNQEEGVYPSTDCLLATCQADLTNDKINKQKSPTGASLDSSKQAYPCWKNAVNYPEAALTIQSLANSSYVTVMTADLSIGSDSLKNTDLASQWADVESERFQSWSDHQITLGIRKYWGKIDNKMTGDYEIIIQGYNSFTQQFANGLQFEITDNLSLSGYNISLSVVNFGWAATMFVFCCLGFYYRATKRSSNGAAASENSPAVVINFQDTNF